MQPRTTSGVEAWGGRESVEDQNDSGMLADPDHAMQPRTMSDVEAWGGRGSVEDQTESG